jgi:hypothetical protein
MNKLKKSTALFLFLLLSVAANAQDLQTTMRSSGRIYVVVAVVVTILLGLIVYVVRLDRKMTRLEKENRQ